MKYGKHLRKRKRFSARGRSSGTFNSAVKSGVSRALREGVVVKTEKQGTASDAKCIYIGHNSHSLNDTVRCIGYSIMRLCCKYWKRDMSDIQDTVEYPLTYRINYQDSYNSEVKNTAVTTTAGDSFKDIAEAMINSLMGLIVSATDNFFVREIIIGRLDDASANATTVDGWSYQKITLHGNDLRIGIHGKSVMKLQNITVSSTGDSVANEQSDDIANNPLRGKRYFGKGYQHRYRWSNDTTAPSPILFYSAPYGFLTQAHTAFGTGYNEAMRRALQKPPPYKAFTNMIGNAYVHINPGEIKTSVVQDYYEMNLNGWLYKLFDVFRTAANVGTTGTDAPIQARCDLGKNSLIGLEHVVDIGSEPDVTVAYEVSMTTSAVAKHKHSNFCQPYISTDVPLA